MNGWTHSSRCGLFIVAVLSIRAGVATAAPTATATDQPPPITLPLEGRETSPSFKTIPSQEEIWRDYPKLANLMGMTGRVQVTCDVQADATVDHCVADTEFPTGLGFGAAAIHVARGFHMNPATLDGMPIKAKYTTSIRFVTADRPPPKPVAEAAPSSAVRLALAQKMVGVWRYKEIATRLYEANLERANQELELNGRPAETQAAMDAFRQGVQDALVVSSDRKARQAAAQMSEADLSASLTFLESSAGQAWLAFAESIDPAEGQDLQSRVMDAARNRFCAKIQCEPASQVVLKAEPPTP